MKRKKKECLMPIEWHEQCLKNSTASADSLRAQMNSLANTLKRLDDDNEKRRSRIAAAKQNGVTELAIR